MWESSLDPADLKPLELEKKKTKKKKEEEDEEDEVVEQGAEAEAEVMTADDTAADSRLVYKRAARHFLRDHLENAQGTEVSHLTSPVTTPCLPYLISFRLTSAHQVTCADFHPGTRILVTGFSHGAFLLLSLPDASLVHSLAIGDQPIASARCTLAPPPWALVSVPWSLVLGRWSQVPGFLSPPSGLWSHPSTRFNLTGDWVALGCPGPGQLLVWEWQSETYVMKQQGHGGAMQCLAYSPDGALVATGGTDAKVKLWNTSSNFCFVTFAEHEAAVTDLAFTPNGKVVVSSSLDGTVRAFDMARYRNFKTLATPRPVQLGCVAVDSSGDLVAAGGTDVFEVYLWSLTTGRWAPPTSPSPPG